MEALNAEELNHARVAPEDSSGAAQPSEVVLFASISDTWGSHSRDLSPAPPAQRLQTTWATHGRTKSAQD